MGNGMATLARATSIADLYGAGAYGAIAGTAAALTTGARAAGPAAAALIAAAERTARVAAVVSRGGRPDLADHALARVTAPTLLIVGADDTDVLRLNEQARARMSTRAHLEIVPGAGHLFEEPGALERVAQLTRDWFVEHLPTARAG
jgi:pimeloyl-ACP methyl ester carboxylesterase